MHLTLGSSDVTSSAPIFSIPIAGISMWPTLRQGDRARLVAPRALALGDVVVLRTGSALVAHRVVGFPQVGSVQTRGDNCEHLDGPVPLTSVLGRVETVARHGRELGAAAWNVGPSTLFRQYLRLRRRLQSSLGVAWSW